MINKIIFRIVLFIFEKLNLVLVSLATASERRNKQISTFLIKSLISVLSKTIHKIGLRNALVVLPDGRSYTLKNEIMLNNKGTNRYLKSRSSNINSEGYWMDQQLIEHGIIPKTIVDIGANFGEISLYFSKKYPTSKIYSIEPSPQNLLYFKDNLEIQYFMTDNIKVIKKAISDKIGQIKITSGLNSENSIVTSRTSGGTKGNKYDIVETTTLSLACKQYQIYDIDFLKIDIEGSEPLLTSCLDTLIPNIKSMLIEFSDKNSFESYEKLLKVIYSHEMICYKKGDSINNQIEIKEAIEIIKKLDPKKNIKKGITEKFVSIDFFFIKKELIKD